MKRISLVTLCLGLFFPVTLAAQAPSAAGLKFFETKIRPVLVKRCYKCHSAQAVKKKKLEGGLQLDTREGIRKGGDSGPAVVPRNAKASLLLEAIRHESFEMPPDTKLPAAVIADFQKWVEMGAPDPRDRPATVVKQETINIEKGRRFWSFQPLRQARPPAVKNNAWVKTDVDRFILAPLEARGIAPNSAAGRETLIRRAYFDLWGLPPEPEVVDAFLADQAEDAYERMIDRLLAGQHYGERWARHWLDLARFAESNGYAFDKDRNAAYHYRDFIIKALNQDMPYDRFVRLQIAGDQIEPGGLLSHAATGFLAAGPFTSQQTQKERERSRYEQLDDIAGTLGTAMLGMTIGCARCHDHKFDPLPTHDYYRLVASFAETGFDNYNYDPDPETTRRNKLAFDKAHQPYVAARVKFEKEQLPGRLDQWLKSKADAPLTEKFGVWQAIGPFTAADFKKTFDQPFAPEKKVELKKRYGDRSWQARPSWKDGVVYQELQGDNSAHYLYRTIDAPFAGQVETTLAHVDGIKVILNGKAILSQDGRNAKAAKPHKVTLTLKAGRNTLLLKIVNVTGKVAFSFTPRAIIPKNIQAILKVAPAKRNNGQKQALLKWFGQRDGQWVKLQQAEQQHLKKQPKPKLTPIFSARKGGATYNFGANTRKVYFLARGNSNSKQGQAKPGFLRVLMTSKDQEQRWLAGKSAQPPRVALARWISDPKAGAGHLLARVIVNRLWQHHMGRGIVATPSDFGTQGARPTHPDLLDYLARELIRGGWRLKPIHKLIMTSAVYRQSGATNARAAKADPDNLLWWRRPARRLDAEVIRDTLLVVAGTLDKKMFGPGSLDQASTRRSVYLKMKRSRLIPILQLFDAPDAIQSIGNREVTTVPPQALALMNSPLVRQLAEKFAQRIQAGGKRTPEQLVERAYQLTLSRRTTEDERKQMVQFLHTQSGSYGSKEKLSPVAVADYCQLMLCLNEFIYID